MIAHPPWQRSKPTQEKGHFTPPVPPHSPLSSLLLLLLLLLWQRLSLKLGKRQPHLDVLGAVKQALIQQPRLVPVALQHGRALRERVEGFVILMCEVMVISIKALHRRLVSN